MTRRRVLVFEDDADTRQLLAELLGEFGFDAVTSGHEDLPGTAALSLVLTDLVSNGGRYSSPSATRWVARLRRTYGAPVLVVTGQAEAWVDARLTGVAAGVVRKPIDLADLQARVGALARPS